MASAPHSPKFRYMISWQCVIQSVSNRAARSDLEVLLLPLLHMLYTAPGRAPSHLYMLLIILLILTQDASFAANVHKVQLSSVPWYRERLLNKTLLGELL